MVLGSTNIFGKKGNTKKNLKKNSRKRDFSGNYTSEKQAFYYELAKREGVDIENRSVMKNFILKKNKEIFNIIEKTTQNKEKGHYLSVVEEIRRKYNMPKYFPLDFLQKVVGFESNKKAFDNLGVDYEELLKLPKNKIIQNESIDDLQVVRIEDLVEAQTDNDFGFMIEWIANAIDASTPGESIGRFGEGFLQSLEKIDIPGSKIIVSTKAKNSVGYNVYMKKDAGELKFGSLENDKLENGTSVKIEKKFTIGQIEEIKKIIISKVKTNTKANIILNGEKLNDLSEYKYINGKRLDLSGIPTIELKLSENGFEVIDNGKGMDEDTIVKKLLRPNSTGNERKVLEDDEVIDISKKETKFFYKEKQKVNEKTKINLNISGINIESFEVSTIGNIADFTLEFPSSSPLKDSRNEIDLTREVSYSMGLILEKIEKKSDSLEEKLALLEISGIIYERLKERSSDIVDEKFVLGTIMKKNFEGIKQNLESQGVSVLPADKNLVETLGKQDNVFYINKEFINFDINSIKNKKEIEKVEAVTLKGSLIGEKYKFFELDFAETSQYDYLVFEGNIFINSRLLNGKTEEQKDKIISTLNKSINLNTSYEVASQVKNYGRILTSGEEFVVKSEKKVQTVVRKDSQTLNTKLVEDNLYYGEDEQKMIEIKNSILKELDNLRKKYENKIDKFGLLKNGALDVVLGEDAFFVLHGDYESRDNLNSKNVDYEDIRRKILFKIKSVLLTGYEFQNRFINDINFNSDYEENYFNLIMYILDNKSEKITKPYIEFIKKLHGTAESRLKQIKTLNKIIDSDNDTALELIQRFEETNIWNIFRDFDRLEKKIEEEKNNEKIKDKPYILALDEKYLPIDLRNFLGKAKITNIDYYPDISFKNFGFLMNNIDFKGLGNYLELKKDFIKFYEENNGLLKQLKKENFSKFTTFLKENIYSKYFDDETIARYINPYALYVYFKFEDEIIKKKALKDKNESDELVKEKFLDGKLLDYKGFIDDFSKIYSSYKEQLEKLEKKHISGNFSESSAGERLVYYNARRSLKFNEFSNLLDSYGFKGDTNSKMVFIDILFKISLGAIDIEYEMEHQCKAEYYDFQTSVQELLDENNNIIEGKKSEEIKLERDFYKGVKKKYGIDLYDKMEIENQLWLEYNLVTRLNKEKNEKQGYFENNFLSEKNTKFFNDFLYLMKIFPSDERYENELKIFKNHYNLIGLDKITRSGYEYYRAINTFLLSLEQDEVLELRNYVLNEGHRNNDNKFREMYQYIVKLKKELEKIGLDTEEDLYGEKSLFLKLGFYFDNEGVLFNALDKTKNLTNTNSQDYEYKIDKTDSIFDDKFSFILDIIKELDKNWQAYGYDYDDLDKENAYNYYLDLFLDIVGLELYISDYNDIDFLKTEKGKQKQKELFEALIKNPEYRYLFKKPKSKSNKTKNLDIFTELSKKYPQDLVTFLQFLKGGGEFLKNDDLKVEEFKGDMEIKLSDLIGINAYEQESIEKENNLGFIKKLKDKHLKAGFNHNNRTDVIAGVNTSQDSVGMLYLREGVQNSTDAIKRYNKENLDKKVEEKVNVDFYSVDNHFVSSVSDPVGMDLKTVIIKLLIPYNSGKDALDAGVGQFGKGFFTFATNSKQIRIKTSIGDGKVYYLELNPKKTDGVVSNFDIKISEKQEDFKGTTIERIDEAEGISGNLRAMIGVNLAKKYVGNVRGIDIEYNGSTLNQKQDLEVISSVEGIVGKDKNGKMIDLGNLELMKNKDNISRFTKNDLWISEIKDDLLSDLPDWMKEFFMENNLTVNIPEKIPLIGSRNSIKNRKYYIKLLQPYFYKQVIDLVLKSYVGRDFKIPMMPEDYLMMTKYDFFHSSEILDLAKRFNNNSKIDFSSSEIELLKDKEQMREFIVLCNFEFKGEKTSLFDIKQSLHSNEIKKSNAYKNMGTTMKQKVIQAIDYKEITKNDAPEYNLSLSKIEKKTGIEKQKVKDFTSFIQKDFEHLIKKHFDGNFEISFYSGKKGVANNFSNHGNGMAFNINVSEFQSLVLNYKNPKVYEELIDIVTHEMTHNLEGDKWATHETDEDHPKSFMRIHRMLLRDFVRSV